MALPYARSTVFRRRLFADRQEVSLPDFGRFSECVVRFVASVDRSALVVPRFPPYVEVSRVTLNSSASISKKLAGFETEPSSTQMRVPKAAVIGS